MTQICGYKENKPNSKISVDYNFMFMIMHEYVYNIAPYTAVLHKIIRYDNFKE